MPNAHSGTMTAEDVAWCNLVYENESPRVTARKGRIAATYAALEAVKAENERLNSTNGSLLGSLDSASHRAFKKDAELQSLRAQLAEAHCRNCGGKLCP